MTDLTRSPLGHATTYAERYDPSLLFPVDRAPLRAELGVGAELPFAGVDLWTAYELSWLDPAGRPRVAVATFAVPATSPRLVESKSVKLYLTSFNLTRFASEVEVEAAIARDLSAATGEAVRVEVVAPAQWASRPRVEFSGDCLDALPLALDAYEPDPDALATGGAIVAESLYTRLFRSMCPVTGQPDYASIEVRYRGPRIERGGMLRYLVSFRRHPGFHEHCVERIYTEIRQRCAPEALTVYARFARRGGLDINPYRTSGAVEPPSNIRTAQQ